jgi:hypothetical protein
MSELTTKRTLVKSPPELWAEVSDLEALAKHLGEFGEIKITRLEPETTVVWEGDRVSGTVQLEPSGWGTKVTLTAELVAIEEPEPLEAPAVAEPGAVEEPVIEEEVVEEPVAVEEPTPVDEPVAVEEPTPVEEPVAVEPPGPSMPEQPRPGFWARLFGRRSKLELSTEVQRAEVPPAEPPPTPPPVDEPEPEPEPVEEPPAPEPPPLQPVPDPEPDKEPEPEDPLPAAKLDDDRAVAVLTEVLDNLGSAHHRPFSRG